MGVAELLGEIHVLLWFLAVAVGMHALLLLLQVAVTLSFARLCDAVKREAASEAADVALPELPYRSASDFLSERRHVVRALCGMDRGVRISMASLRADGHPVGLAARVAPKELLRTRRVVRWYLLHLVLQICGAIAMLVYAVRVLLRILEA